MPPETTQNIYTQERLPEWIQPYYTNLASEAQAQTESPYSAYGGQRLAGATGFENAAQAGIGALGMSGGPWQTGAASQATQGAMQGLPGLGQQMGMYAGQFGDIGQQAQNTPMSTGQDWQQYMNPYTQNVTNVLARKAQQYGDVQRSELGSRAAAAGAFGGSRHGLGERGIERDVRQQVQDINSQGLNTAFDRGLSMFESDRSAGQAGLGLGMQALGGGLGALGAQAGAYGQQGQMAGQLAGLGQLGQDQNYQRLGAMEQAGARQRALQQAGMDIGYQDFQNQESYGRDQLSWLGSILGGFPQQQNTNQQSTGQNPGIWQSLLGTGVAGLGMYNAYNAQSQ